MKQLHREDIYCWSEYNAEKQIDFHAFLIERMEGNILIDPLPLSEEDERFVRDMGPIEAIIVTTSDHLRAADEISNKLGIPIYAPQAEQEDFPVRARRWLKDGDLAAEGLQVIALEGSKTPGELALLLEETTLITGDLVRSHQEGSLNLLPDDLLSDKKRALASLKRLAELPKVETVLVGDGSPILSAGKAKLEALLQSSG